jgi:DNA-directed RNA polymerase subunit N (RpoN/RPB10)
MIIPVRCLECGKTIGNKWEPYCKLIADVKDGGEGKSIDEALTILGLIRGCCRNMLMTHVEAIDDMLKYPELETVFKDLKIDRSGVCRVYGGEKFHTLNDRRHLAAIKKKEEEEYDAYHPIHLKKLAALPPPEKPEEVKSGKA